MIFKRIRNWLYPESKPLLSTPTPTPTHSKGPGKKKTKKPVLPKEVYKNAKIELKKVIDDFRKNRAKKTQPSPNIWWCLNHKRGELCKCFEIHDVRRDEVHKAWKEIVSPIEPEIWEIQNNSDKHKGKHQKPCSKEGWKTK
ncbi:MAG: hypothetical protein K0U41_09015 [Gammaproteobacteria bacterium]|nr:hypothetical protein [Gammaproteobacteria bacterium]